VTPSADHPGLSRRLLVVVAALAVAGVALVLATSGGHRGGSLRAGGGNPLATAGPRERTPPTATAPPVTTTTTTPIVPMVIAPGTTPTVSRVATPDRVVFLGIDDGLVRDPAVLDYLAANRIPFTSFLVANALQADPAFWARAGELGGAVEAHTLTHPNLTKVSADTIRREVCGSADLIEQATGRRPTFFRPPYGAFNETVRSIAGQCGFQAIVMWKGATNDGRVDLQEGTTFQPGDILLMHWRADLLLNLQKVVEKAQAEGFRIARLEDYLQALP
jgi:peptidoglycan/xylan/chitin deacetylase (PgdA/CDA1 family)